jgi:hypothetical protein
MRDYWLPLRSPPQRVPRLFAADSPRDGPRSITAASPQHHRSVSLDLLDLHTRFFSLAMRRAEIQNARASNSAIAELHEMGKKPISGFFRARGKTEVKTFRRVNRGADVTDRHSAPT